MGARAKEREKIKGICIQVFRTGRSQPLKIPGGGEGVGEGGGTFHHPASSTNHVPLRKFHSSAGVISSSVHPFLTDQGPAHLGGAGENACSGDKVVEVIST